MQLSDTITVINKLISSFKSVINYTRVGLLLSTQQASGYIPLRIGIAGIADIYTHTHEAYPPLYLYHLTQYLHNQACVYDRSRTYKQALRPAAHTGL